MNLLFEKIYDLLPDFFQNLAVTFFDLDYLKRRSGNYKKYKYEFLSDYLLSKEGLQAKQDKLFKTFISYVNEKSVYYRNRWKNVELDSIRSVKEINKLPIVTKDELCENVNSIFTIPSKGVYEGHTGGTTGMSLTVRYSWDDFRNRMAILDGFREMYGWRLGKKTAWFSGKKLLAKKDVDMHRFWKNDYIFRIRYYSTFHITEETLPYYIENLNKFKPEYIVGFPSNIFEIANYCKNKGMKLKTGTKAIFATAETLIFDQVKVIEEQFGCNVIDQYASSEGAPFIIECVKGKNHILPTTGIIEVLDEDGNPASSGEMVITSFSTHGTPLVRYKIGDTLELAPDTGKPCECGSFAPVVSAIHGRINDFIYSRERGKINLGNVSNCVKYASGVNKFQVIQNSFDEIIVKMVVDRSVYSDHDEFLIKREFVNRLGAQIAVTFSYVDDIPREKSGKYRIVINKLCFDQK